jgi:hypothetical protein
MRVNTHPFQKSLALPQSDRAELVGLLLCNLADDSDEDAGEVEKEWAAELDRCLDRIEAGQAKWHEPAPHCREWKRPVLLPW